MKHLRDYFKLNRAPAAKSRSKYMPHQGAQELARRKKQQEKAAK